jgi:hypothetical protein
MPMLSNPPALNASSSTSTENPPIHAARFDNSRCSDIQCLDRSDVDMLCLSDLAILSTYASYIVSPCDSDIFSPSDIDILSSSDMHMIHPPDIDLLNLFDICILCPSNFDLLHSIARRRRLSRSRHADMLATNHCKTYKQKAISNAFFDPAFLLVNHHSRGCRHQLRPPPLHRVPTTTLAIPRRQYVRDQPFQDEQAESSHFLLHPLYAGRRGSLLFCSATEIFHHESKQRREVISADHQRHRLHRSLLHQQSKHQSELGPCSLVTEPYEWMNRTPMGFHQVSTSTSMPQAQVAKTNISSQPWPNRLRSPNPSHPRWLLRLWLLRLPKPPSPLWVNLTSATTPGRWQLPTNKTPRRALCLNMEHATGRGGGGHHSQLHRTPMVFCCPPPRPAPATTNQQPSPRRSSLPTDYPRAVPLTIPDESNETGKS